MTMRGPLLAGRGIAGARRSLAGDDAFPTMIDPNPRAHTMRATATTLGPTNQSAATEPLTETAIWRNRIAGPPIHHLNQTELSRRWRISPRTLERWRWLNVGPRYIKIGGRVVYRLEDIEAFEAAQACG